MINLPCDIKLQLSVDPITTLENSSLETKPLLLKQYSIMN